MKIIKPNAEYMEHDCTPYQFIEKVGRVCYKSEDKITEDSAEKFIKGLVERKHHAMLEHETLFFMVTSLFLDTFISDLEFGDTDTLKYLNITKLGEYDSVISGSFRSFLDLFNSVKGSIPVDYLRYKLKKEFPLVFGEVKSGEEKSVEIKDGIYTSALLVERDSFMETYKEHRSVLKKHLTHTVKFTCDRGVTHEFVRHRPCSFAQESTRYCNYSNDKFGNEITVIEPLFFEEDSEKYLDWKRLICLAEAHYFDLLELGATPQEARSVLPNSLKTELVITATEKEWQHIVDLRYRGTTGAPHPQMKEVMSLAVKDLYDKSEGRITYETN